MSPPSLEASAQNRRPIIQTTFPSICGGTSSSLNTQSDPRLIRLPLASQRTLLRNPLCRLEGRSFCYDNSWHCRQRFSVSVTIYPHRFPSTKINVCFGEILVTGSLL
ncbi:hypothetical protein CEXT_482891 [Caerostris extrusa]|uniref:Uncharacterized protein n=1 Tax=Caerostris extrusa TaxID=172846 RepID=A0AAV4RZA9_CAEEX|nr:hypothetical protein CEXT_482891 [Caerostris extrusa]